MYIKKLVLTVLLIGLYSFTFGQNTKSLYKDTLHPDPWSLIISRPESTPVSNS